jgi:short-subunit dehydrogenase
MLVIHSFPGRSILLDDAHDLALLNGGSGGHGDISSCRAGTSQKTLIISTRAQRHLRRLANEISLTEYEASP